MQKLLFVGGKAPFLNSIKKKLARRGYEVVIAYDGEEGIEKARGEHPELIILDIKRYVTAGYALFRELKLDERAHNVPIIVCAPGPLRDDTDDSQLAGADGYIEKPFEISELLVKIGNLSGKPFNKAFVGEKDTEERKRKYPRLKKDVIIDFKLVNAPGDYQMGKSVDVSSTGVKLEAVCTDRPPVKGQFIEMVFKGDRPGEEVKTLGEVMWMNQMRFSLNTKMGIKLIFLSAGDAEKIKKLLKYST